MPLPRDTPLRSARTFTQARGAELLDAAGARIWNPELHRPYKEVDLLPDEDQKALLVVLDLLSKRSGMSRLMAE